MLIYFLYNYYNTFYSSSLFFSFSNQKKSKKIKKKDYTATKPTYITHILLIYLFLFSYIKVAINLYLHISGI